MTSYRRAKIVEHIDLLKRSLRDEQKAHPFRINALVVLPDPLHPCSRFQRAMPTIQDGGGVSRPRFRQRCHRLKGERSIWPRRFWEHLKYAMKRIMRGTWLTSISLRLSVAM